MAFFHGHHHAICTPRNITYAKEDYSAEHHDSIAVTSKAPYPPLLLPPVDLGTRQSEEKEREPNLPTFEARSLFGFSSSTDPRFMGRSLSPMLRQELANLDKDADSRRSAMTALKSYAKDLDSKHIPSGERTISLYEVLARVHGRNIVPQIDSIMSTIMRTLSSSGGSSALHQACSRVVPAIARHGIDPSTPDDEKTRIVRSLCKPLSDALMGSHVSAAAGAALCLKALVESGNWTSAPGEMVNEVCLRVAVALEEKATQTSAHMSLAMALAKHNGLVAEAYSRSLVRSGLQILAAGAAASNSQKRLSAVQMINFLMKCVDPRSISSEVFKIVDVMEKCQADDKMPLVRSAASEALQTAKALSTQRGSKLETGSSPVVNSNFRRRNQRSPRHAREHLASVCSPESHTVDSSIKNDVFADSPVSVGQSSCSIESSRHPNRRLWSRDACSVDVSLKDGLFLKRMDFEHISEGKPSDSDEERPEAFSGFAPANDTEVAGDTTPSPQRPISQLKFDDFKIYTTPRKLIRSLQNLTEPDTENTKNQSIALPISQSSHEVEWKPNGAFDKDRQPQNLNSEAEQRCFEDVEWLGKMNHHKDAEPAQDGTESVSSTGDVPESSICKVLDGADYEDKNSVVVKSRNRIGYTTAALGLIWGAFMVLLATIFSSMWTDNDELVFDMVPT
ncbi:unnamed protein product [Musa hybrid cultivar]